MVNESNCSTFAGGMLFATLTGPGRAGGDTDAVGRVAAAAAAGDETGAAFVADAEADAAGEVVRMGLKVGEDALLRYSLGIPRE